MSNDLISPFDGLSDEIRSALIRSGWRPGERRNPDSFLTGCYKSVQRRLTGKAGKEFDDRFDGEFPAATQVLDELDGVCVRQIRQSSSSKYALGSSIKFRRIGRDDELRQLEEILSERLVVIGWTDWHSHVTLAESGRMYEYGVVAEGLFFLGNSFAEGVTRQLTGMKSRPIFVSDAQDPDHDFRLDDLSPDDPDVLIPSPESGLRDVDTTIYDE
ncbi:hypothetical protein KOR42_50550 [Thalassoglobus neptunius]|uniref:Uncharacterized protein n=1 Tax=Thalassoglobus neptunius TaxID=1938619 RepID=A0A5C5VQG1_9PLAN|nr:SUKH-3 domain-containing protein [Thalassoglobus neptunius]TWT39909.1 hypothetical protein KOR42_50550 [Thalassoglobus neptunius]